MTRVTDLVNAPSGQSAQVTGAPAGPTGQTRTGMTADALRAAVSDHLVYSIARPPAVLQPEHYYRALSLAVRDRMQKRWMATTQDWLDLSAKVTCYLSAEFLMGPQLGNNLLNLGIEDEARRGAGRSRPGPRRDPGLRGRAGPGQRRPRPAGRLLLDSLATLELPAIGYGIRYEFGIFDQEIDDGWQVEQHRQLAAHRQPVGDRRARDAQLPVQLRRPHRAVPRDATGRLRVRWVPQRGARRALRHAHRRATAHRHREHAAPVGARGRASPSTCTSSTTATTGAPSTRRSTPRTSPRSSTRTTSPTRARSCGCKQQYFFVACSLAGHRPPLQRTQHADFGASRTRSPSSSTTPTRRSRSPS